MLASVFTVLAQYLWETRQRQFIFLKSCRVFFFVCFFFKYNERCSKSEKTQNQYVFAYRINKTKMALKDVKQLFDKKKLFHRHFSNLQH